MAIAEVHQPDLFGPHLTIDAEQVAEVRQISPLTHQWIRSRMGPRLDLIAKSLQDIGVAKTPDEAIGYIDRVIRTKAGSLTKLKLRATAGTRHSGGFRRLKKKMGIESPYSLEIFGRQAGIAGHGAMTEYLEEDVKDRVNQAQTVDLGQIPLLGMPDLEAAGAQANEAWDGTRLSDQFHMRVGECVRSIRRMTDGRSWNQAYPFLNGAGKRLTELMFQFAPEQVAFLQRKALDIDGGEMVLLRSLTCWGEALGYMDGLRDYNQLICRESPVFDGSLGFDLGRIDGLMIPRDQQIERIPKESVYAAIRRLASSGRQFDSTWVVDLKFVAGDGHTGDQAIEPEHVQNGPLPKHRTQMRRYVHTSQFDHHRGTQPRSEPFLGGKVVYVVDGGAVEHTITPNPEEYEAAIKDYAPRIVALERDSLHNALDSLVIDDLLARKEALSPKLFDISKLAKSGRKNGSVKSKKAAAEPLFQWRDNTDHPLIKTLQENRQFLDEQQIFETVVNGKGQTEVVAHAERLYDLATFNDKGKLVCHFHNAKDKATMRLITDALICSDCGIRIPIHWGVVVPETPLIKGKRVRVKAEPQEDGSYRVNPTADELFKKREKMMLLAKEIGQSKFWGTAGEEAVGFEKGLNPDFAYQMGAGYGENLAIELLGWDYDYEELLTAGLIEISDRATAGTELYKALRKKGLQPHEIRRLYKPKGAKDYKWGFPYDPAQGRILFFSELYGRTVGVSGSATEKSNGRKAEWHNFDRQGVPIGGYNLQALDIDSPYSEIATFKTPLEAVTFQFLTELQPDLWQGMGAIATNERDNPHVLKQLADSTKVDAIYRRDLLHRLDTAYPMLPYSLNIHEMWLKNGMVIRSRLRR